MIYAVIKETGEPKRTILCLCKTDCPEEARRMVGVKDPEAPTGAFTGSEISALESTQEGYVSAFI